MLLQLAAPRPESSWAFEPFKLLLELEPRGFYVQSIIYLKHLNVCKLECLFFISMACVVLSLPPS
jgi:hypothetical protein